MRTLTATLAASLLAFGLAANAAPPEFKPSAKMDMASLLATRINTLVTLKLSSGEELTGTLKAAGNALVHLNQLAGREYFDAAIPVERIEAVIVRIR